MSELFDIRYMDYEPDEPARKRKPTVDRPYSADNRHPMIAHLKTEVLYRRHGLPYGTVEQICRLIQRIRARQPRRQDRRHSVLTITGRLPIIISDRMFTILHPGDCRGARKGIDESVKQDH